MLKSLDFFRKIQTEQELTSATGGIFTIVALLAAGLLILMSFQDFSHEKYYTFLGVKNDESEYLPLRIDMIFNKMPCEAIQIQFHDQLEYVESNLENRLKMFSIPKNEQTGALYTRNPNDSNLEREELKKHLEGEFQCRLTGILNIPKTPGTLTFRASAQNNLIMNIDQHLIDRTRMSYRIDALEFGLGNNTFDFPIAHKSKNIQNYIKQLEGDLLTRKFIQDFTNQNQKNDYFNHIKIIPVVIDDINKDAEQNEKYRYSLRSGLTANHELTQKVMFMTELEPINIIYKKSDASLYDLIVQILAIVGGTVATIGLVNSISHFLFGIK